MMQKTKTDWAMIKILLLCHSNSPFNDRPPLISYNILSFCFTPRGRARQHFVSICLSDHEMLEWSIGGYNHL